MRRIFGKTLLEVEVEGRIQKYGPFHDDAASGRLEAVVGGGGPGYICMCQVLFLRVTDIYVNVTF